MDHHVFDVDKTSNLTHTAFNTTNRGPSENPISRKLTLPLLPPVCLHSLHFLRTLHVSMRPFLDKKQMKMPNRPMILISITKTCMQLNNPLAQWSHETWRGPSSLPRWMGKQLGNCSLYLIHGVFELLLGIQKFPFMSIKLVLLPSHDIQSKIGCSFT